MKPMGAIPPSFSADASGQLVIGGRPVEDIVAEAGGTPLFVYDNNVAGTQIARLRMALTSGVALHYAVKANVYPELLMFLARHVDGFDIASEGELEQLREACIEGLPISFAGPGKRDRELEAAIAAEVTINVESESEAGRAIRAGERLGVRPKLAVRINPPFLLRGAGMKMGGLASQFGVDHDRAAAIVQGIIEAGADWRGLHIFAGSQCLDSEALVEAQRASLALAAQVAEQAGAAPPELNLGGGFGVPYFAGEQPLDVEEVGSGLAEALCEAPAILATTGIALELGRYLVAECGVYLTRIVDRKQSRDRTFLVTDGGLHHMLAATGNFGQLLRRNYPVAIATRFGAPAEEEASITGCLCTPLDLLADDVSLPVAGAGDLVAIFYAGAYGRSASPEAFLSQPPAREIMV